MTTPKQFSPDMQTTGSFSIIIKINTHEMKQTQNS